MTAINAQLNNYPRSSNGLKHADLTTKLPREIKHDISALAGPASHQALERVNQAWRYALEVPSLLRRQVSCLTQNRDPSGELRSTSPKAAGLLRKHLTKLLTLEENYNEGNYVTTSVFRNEPSDEGTARRPPTRGYHFIMPTAQGFLARGWHTDRGQEVDDLCFSEFVHHTGIYEKVRHKGRGLKDWEPIMGSPGVWTKRTKNKRIDVLDLTQTPAHRFFVASDELPDADPNPLRDAWRHCMRYSSDKKNLPT